MTATVTWPSIDDSKPAEEGGPAARHGFNYQDEIAVGFLIEMLATPNLLKVHCETHDDIVAVRSCPAVGQIAEYVQVKGSQQDQLWSVANLCSRPAGKPGSSIFEVSLARDQHKEISRFRIVTLRSVNSALAPLTYQFSSPSRVPDAECMKQLCAELDNRCPGFVSKKGNGSAFWLQNCYWDQRDSESAVQSKNLIGLLQLSSSEGRPLLFEPANMLLDELRAMAKSAADAKWDPDPHQKIITRDSLRIWWETRTSELMHGATEISGGKLATKMKEAGLPEEIILLASDLRRSYAAEARTPRYLEPEESERLQRQVRSEVLSLRARFVAGSIDLTGAGFHALCLDRMDALNTSLGASSEDRAAFIKGCMYDITDRCLHRFARPVA